MIGLAFLVGLVPPWVGPSCGMAPWVQFAAMAFKIALGCVIGGLAGFLGNVKGGAVAGTLIGGFAGACFGSPIGITFNSPLARFGIGAGVGGLIGALGGLAGKTTPHQDRIACGYSPAEESKASRQTGSGPEGAAPDEVTHRPDSAGGVR